MHALTILHRILSENFPAIHAKRLASLMAAVEATVSGSRLTLSDLGRGLSGPVAVKHNIKRMASPNLKTYPLIAHNSSYLMTNDLSNDFLFANISSQLGKYLWLDAK